MKRDLLFGFGRLNRIHFLALINISFIVLSTVGVGLLTIFPDSDQSILEISVIAIFFLIAFKFSIQRYHDLEANGFWALSCLTPGLPIIIVILGLIPGDNITNRYGAKNKEPNILLKALAILPLPIVIFLLIYPLFGLLPLMQL